MPFELTLSPHLDAARENVGDLVPRDGHPRPRASGTSRRCVTTTWHCARPASTRTGSPEELDLASRGWCGAPTPTTTTRACSAAGLCRRAGKQQPAEGVDAGGAVRAVGAAGERASNAALADLWTRTAGPMTLAARAAVPARRRDDARQLAVGAGQPAHEPHPGPGGLRGDAPAHVRFGPDDEPGADRPPGRAARRRSTAPGRCSRWRTRRWTPRCLLNDMFSYRKEIEFEGEVHNAVLVVRNFLGCAQERGVRGGERPADRAGASSSSTWSTRSCRRWSPTCDGPAARRAGRATSRSCGTGWPASSTGTASATATRDADLRPAASSAPARVGALTGLGTSAARLTGGRRTFSRFVAPKL